MVVVAYGISTLDRSWLPDGAELVVVHNDDRLDPASVGGHGARHVRARGNIGFGAAVNLALPFVTTARVVLCNPDVTLEPGHWDALLDANPDEIVTVPLVDDDGCATSVTSGYPTPLSLLASGYRLGRLAPRGSRTRNVLSRALGRWGRAHAASLTAPTGSWPLVDRWVSGAVLSIDAARLRSIGGFDDRYFLYYEDVDLCLRFARRYPTARARVAAVEPGRHTVGASAGPDARRAGPAEQARLDSAIRYARTRSGPSWTLTTAALGARRRAMSRAARS